MAEFLERQDELQLLDGALAQARSGNGQVALVSGEAGIGKTTLVEAFLDHDRTECRVLRGYCDPLFTPTALGPLRDMARDLGKEFQDLNYDDDGRAVLFAQLLDMLHATRQVVILVFEDVHWADEATIDLIRFLGRRIHDLNVLMIATFRDDEVARHDALRFLLGEFATNAAVHRVEVQRLSLAAVRILAHGFVEDADRLHRVTGGNPFYVTEVIARPNEGIPGTVRDAVLGRAAQLGPDGRNLLDTAAAAGARVEYALLEHLPDFDEAALQECTSTGLLAAGQNTVAFRHELARTAVLESIEPLRRRALSRQVLEAALLAGFERERQFARLSHYAESAGLAEDVTRYGTEAGRIASALGAYREAAAHFRSVVKFSDGRSDPERAQSLVYYAHHAAIVDQLAESIDAYREAADLWAKAGEPIRQGQTLAALAWPLVRHGENAQADRAAAEAVSLLEPFGISRELASAKRTMAHLLMLDRQCRRAVEVGRAAIEMATGTGDVSTLAEAEMTVGSARLVMDDPEGRKHLDRCIRIAGENALDEIVALARMNIGSAYGEQYRFAEAESELQKGLGFCAEHDLDHSGNYMQSWLALTHVFQGRWAEAADICNALLAKPDLAQISRIMALAALGRLMVRNGDAAASEVLDEALALAQRTGTLQRLAPIHAARAELAWYNGDPDRVRSEARATLELARDRRHAWHVGEFSYWLHVAGNGEPAESWIAAPFAMQISGKWQQAAAFWRQRKCPFEEARALSEGDHEARLQALSIFDRLAARPAAAALRRDMRKSGVRRIPRGPRSSTLQNRFGLTRRELTILGHLVQKHSNSAIAEQLFISPKTVDHHVSSILQKLNVASRTKAAEMALKEGLLPQNGDGPG